MRLPRLAIKSVEAPAFIVSVFARQKTAPLVVFETAQGDLPKCMWCNTKTECVNLIDNRGQLLACAVCITTALRKFIPDAPPPAPVSDSTPT